MIVVTKKKIFSIRYLLTELITWIKNTICYKKKLNYVFIIFYYKFKLIHGRHGWSIFKYLTRYELKIIWTIKIRNYIEIVNNRSRITITQNIRRVKDHKTKKQSV